MQRFRDFVLNEESESTEDVGFPLVAVTAPAGSSFIEKEKRNINADLAEATSAPFSWSNAGYEAIKDVLSEYHMNLPDTYGDLEEDEAEEMVFAIEGSDLYLYLFHEPHDEGIEFYAEVVNENELHEVLDDLDVGENDDDDSDDDGQSDTSNDNDD